MVAVTYRINDFINWDKDGSLDLSPEFQRRSVWPPKAKLYLIDTIINNKPIPKIYMREDVDLDSGKTWRQIIDGQQRIRSIIEFVKDEYPVSKVYDIDIGGKFFSELSDAQRKNILTYELIAEILNDFSEPEIHDVFTRLNTFSISLNAQEIRNGRYFGEFKSLVYSLDKEFIGFWKKFKIFKDTQIARMYEVELISELLIAMCVGISQRERKFIDRFYDLNDDEFPNYDFPSLGKLIPSQSIIRKRFVDTLDMLGEILDRTEAGSKIREARMIYALFCAIYHMQYSIPNENWPRKKILKKNIGRLTTAISEIENIFQLIEKGKIERKRRNDFNEGSLNIDDLSPQEIEEWEIANNQVELIDAIHYLEPPEKEFYTAYDNRWVHAKNRRIRTDYIVNLFIKFV